jgi:hypothetical protein
MKILLNSKKLFKIFSEKLEKKSNREILSYLPLLKFVPRERLQEVL